MSPLFARMTIPRFTVYTLLRRIPSMLTKLFLHNNQYTLIFKQKYCYFCNFIDSEFQEKTIYAVVVALKAGKLGRMDDCVTLVFDAVEFVVTSIDGVVKKMLSVLSPAVACVGRVLRSSSLELLSDEELLCLCL